MLPILLFQLTFRMILTMMMMIIGIMQQNNKHIDTCSLMHQRRQSNKQPRRPRPFNGTAGRHLNQTVGTDGPSQWVGSVLGKAVPARPDRISDAGAKYACRIIRVKRPRYQPSWIPRHQAFRFLPLHTD